MKNFLYLALVLLAPISSLRAGFEPIVVLFDRPMPMPAKLRMNEVTAAQAIILVEVDAKGKLTDWLLLSASHRELIPLCAKSVPTWFFRPARSDGQPVLAQTRVTVNIGSPPAVTSRLRQASEVTTSVGANGQKISVFHPTAPLPETVLVNASLGTSGRPFDYQVCSQAELDRPPAAIKMTAPIYPREVEKKGAGGRMKVQFFIDEQGRVRMPSVEAETPPELAAVAIKAMKEWKFEPPTRRGQPVLVAAEQEFAFD